LIVNCNGDNNHWYLMILSVAQRCVTFYDGIGKRKSAAKQKRVDIIMNLMNYWFEEESAERRRKMPNWSVNYAAESPKQ